MSSAMMMERTSMGVQGVGVPGLGTPSVGTPGVQGGLNYLVVPRCTLKFEKCTGGFKLTCVCEDKLSSSMVQNLCTMLTGGLCSYSVIQNGMTVCCYNMTMGLCKCETTESGVCITCTSGDQQCCQMIQACCDCLTTYVDCGCTCCVMLNNTPVCCGTSDASKSGVKKTGR